MVHTVSDKADFDAQLESAGDKLVVIDFYATWCGPCKMIAPFFQELSEQYEDVVFLKVDVDDAEEVANIYNVTNIPKFVCLKGKEQVDELCGANQDKLKEMVEKNK